MTSEPPFLLPLARTLALIAVFVLGLGALLGGAVSLGAALEIHLPWWIGSVGGFVAFLLLVLAARAATRPEWRDSWRDCLKR